MAESKAKGPDLCEKAGTAPGGAAPLSGPVAGLLQVLPGWHQPHRAEAAWETSKHSLFWPRVVKKKSTKLMLCGVSTKALLFWFQVQDS